MITSQTITALRAALAPHRAAGKRIAIVPTMGNLHIGHLKLVEAAQQYADIVVATIFVNPMQFGPNEDLDAYPRTLAEDKEKLTDAGAHMLFAPSAKEIYPQGLGGQTQVIVPDVTEELCGASRPGHFTGVTTVVTKLFNIVQPDVALFGKKDFQQLTAIRKMAADLCMPIEVIGVPTVRAEDGLALSSRNSYLNTSERAIAPRLNQVLRDIEAAIRSGDQNYSALCQRGWQELESAGFHPDYLTVRNSQTLREATPEDRELVVLAAAYLGSARLIDNIPFTLEASPS